MRIAINYLKAELRSLKNSLNAITSTDRKIEYSARIDAIEKAIKHLRQVNQKCEWSRDGGEEVFDTQCKRSFRFNYGTCAENKFKFCPYCGREIKEK
jgi:hypothetical protein